MGHCELEERGNLRLSGRQVLRDRFIPFAKTVEDYYTISLRAERGCHVETTACWTFRSVCMLRTTPRQVNSIFIPDSRGWACRLGHNRVRRLIDSPIALIARECNESGNLQISGRRVFRDRFIPFAKTVEDCPGFDCNQATFSPKLLSKHCKSLPPTIVSCD